MPHCPIAGDAIILFIVIYNKLIKRSHTDSNGKTQAESLFVKPVVQGRIQEWSRPSRVAVSPKISSSQWLLKYT